MNLDKWKALPKATQDALDQLTAEFEPKMVKHFDDENETEWKAIGSKVAKVKFSDAENKRYLDTAYDVEWKALQDRAPDAIAKAPFPDRQLTKRHLTTTGPRACRAGSIP